MRIRPLLFTGAVACLAASSTAFADVQITMQGGRVSIVAKDATLRQIMTEWARVGQTKVVNVDRIPGGPMTLELRNVTEDQALDILMRPLSGYVAAPRSAEAPNLSRFDRIMVMPTIAAARSAATPAPGAPAPVFQTPPVFQPPQPAPAEEEETPQPAPRGPVFSAFPQPQVVNPNGAQQNVAPGAEAPAAPPAATAVPSGTGVAVPGMIVPAPQQPGAPAQQNPTLPRRPGGI